jgi:hypothetical protein
MGNWKCEKHNTNMDERSTPCPYCECDLLRAELSKYQISFAETNEHNSRLQTELEQVKQESETWKKLHINMRDERDSERKRADELQKDKDAILRDKRKWELDYCIEKDRADLNEKALELVCKEIYAEDGMPDFFRKLAAESKEG